MCNSNCLECIDESTNCTKCDKPLFLEKNKCVSICPSDKFGNED